VYLKHLSLRNFRNYQELELEAPPGLVVLHGENGQGKSNLLEAVYLLALTRSHRAENERELVRFEALTEIPYARVLGVARRSNQSEVSVQVDMALFAPDTTPSSQQGAGRLRKSIRVNGVPRLASTAIGAIAAVSFAAEDIGLITGPPAGRRHFLDIMASQVDRGYVRASQRYQKVLTQRNHLLRRIKEGAAKTGELAFWDGELCSQGAKILLWRAGLVSDLAPLANQAYQELAQGGEGLEVRYEPNVEPASTEEEQARLFQERLSSLRPREVAVGQTQAGPHRDELRILVRDRELSLYGSRGEARSAALALRLAETELLTRRLEEEPILLLDDVLSELDDFRAGRVLERAARAQQAFLTTASLQQHPKAARQAAVVLEVRGGRLIPEKTAGPPGP
jgi:DNA replication and repair protein RecF